LHKKTRIQINQASFGEYMNFLQDFLFFDCSL